ncbi:MAG: SprB repeat-containing protein, partial [Marinifilaceae bacterium]|nr:SprB repeat-containing protein [Marinifilaceae bacterium]
TGKYRYKWYENGELIRDENSNKISNLAAGDYSLEVWDSNNCPFGNTKFGKNNGLIRKTSVKGPNSELVTKLEYCHKTSYRGKSDGLAKLFSSGGWPPYQYSIDAINWQKDDIFRNLKKGIYKIYAKDNKDIISETIFNIEETEAIKAHLKISNLKCYNDNSGKLEINANGGIPSYMYSIDNAASYTSNPIFNNLSAGKYTLIIQDINKNKEYFSFEIKQPDKLNINILTKKDSKCGKNTGELSLSIEGGTRSYNLIWNKPDMSNNLVFSNLAAGEYNLICKDANNCLAEKDIIINDGDGPIININNIQNCSCYGSSDGIIEIEIKSDVNIDIINWYHDETNKSKIAKNLKSDIYFVEVTDSNNCKNSLEVEIKEPDNLELNVLSINKPTCVGYTDGIIEIEAIGGSPEFNYYYDEKKLFANKLDNISKGKYLIKCIDKNNCHSEIEVKIEDPTPIQINIEDKYIICENQTIHLDAIDWANHFEWFHNSQLISKKHKLEIDREGLYRLEAYNDNGCKATKDFSVFSQSDLIQAKFVAPEEAVPNDTIVAVDISWEYPDSTKWHRPSNFEFIKIEGHELWLKTSDNESGIIGLTAYKGECTSYFEKEININPFAERQAKLLNSEKVYISEAIIYPNPTNGELNVRIVLSQKSELSIDIFDIQETIKVFTKKYAAETVFSFNLDLKNIIKSGRLYSFRINASGNIRNLKFYGL